jgi:hypothetical protein
MPACCEVVSDPLVAREASLFPIAVAGKPEAQAEGIRVAAPETAPDSLGSRLLMVRCVQPDGLMPRKCRLQRRSLTADPMACPNGKW